MIKQPSTFLNALNWLVCSLFLYVNAFFKREGTQRLGRFVLECLVSILEFFNLEKVDERLKIKHMAVIMDGNRRFAESLSLPREAGHSYGFDALKRVLHSCFVAKIRHLTVYAFSVDNFKRPEKEIQTLMNLACEKFEEFCDQSHIVQTNRVKVKVLGELDLLPERVRLAATKAMEMTRDNDQFILNVCMSYGSVKEMENAKSLQLSHNGGESIKDLINDFEKNCLYTRESPPIDVLIRTSGERRLSDFLLWQARNQLHEKGFNLISHLIYI